MQRIRVPPAACPTLRKSHLRVGMQVHRQVGSDGRDEAAALTPEGVEAVLDGVRGFLLADGGDVTVHAANEETGVVELIFRGACASCSAQETTMKLGIERALRAAYGERLKDVVAVSGPDEAAADAGTTVAAVDGLLQLLRPAVTNYGGSVEVEAVEDGVCRIAYSGPEPIWNGLRAAVRDKFADLTAVERV